MTKYITVTSVLAPVEIEMLNRAENLTTIGDARIQDFDENGFATSSLDVEAPTNFMGAIGFYWHDSEDAECKEVDDFIRSFSETPKEIRKEKILDPHGNGAGDCGRYFQSDAGHTYFIDGFLLISPSEDDIETFFQWGYDIATT